MGFVLQLAALLTGFGGLTFELVVLRRHGLLLGNTAGAAALVLGVLLLGLGVGGLWGPRQEVARRRPLGLAAVLYAAVAVVAVLADALLAALPPLGVVEGVVVCAVAVGVPAAAMGAAFPLLFPALPRGAVPWRAGALVGANLAGSVVAALWAGNVLVPQLGLRRSSWVVAGCYGAAALLLAACSRRERRVAPVATPPLPPVGRAERLAFAAGCLTLGLEVLMLRRLPFFLDGFQPTLSGVLAACLLALTAGAVLLVVPLRRAFGERAAAWSLLLAVLVAALGLHELVAPRLGRVGVDSDLAFHLRILIAALAAAGLPCLLLGATVPLCLGEMVHPESRATRAGRLFCAQGVGALCGALATGHLLPLLLPETYFSFALPLLSGAVLLLVLVDLPIPTVCGGVAVAVLALLGISGGTLFRHAAAPVAGSRYDKPERYRYLAHRTDSVVTASVVYDRAAHGLILFTDEFRAAYIDQDSGYMRVLGHLPMLLRPGLRRVAVIALGTGTTANAVVQWRDPEVVHVVETSEAVVALAGHFGKPGPGVATQPPAFVRDPRTRVHVTDGRRFLARAAPHSLDLISMEPLLPYAPGTVPLYTAEFYRLCGKALAEDGLMVQWVPTHSMPRSYFATLLATFARGFAHHSVWLFNHSTLLIGSARPHLPAATALAARLSAMPQAARRDLHAAGVATAEDLAIALCGDAVPAVCGDAEPLLDDRPFLERIGYWSAAQRLAFLPDNLELLARLAALRSGAAAARQSRLRGLATAARARGGLAGGDHALAVRALAESRARAPGSLLLYEELRRARRELLEQRLLGSLPVPFDRDACRARIDRPALRQALQRDPSSALGWAVLAVTATVEKEQHDDMQRALAIDPTFYRRFPQLMIPWIDRGKVAAYRGPFEDLAELPAQLCNAATNGPEAVAYLAHFRVAVGYALVDALAGAPLPAEQRRALVEVADPVLLRAALQAVAARRGDTAAEILPLWRRDLAMPEGLATLAKGPVHGRKALAGALAGRKARAELLVLAGLLMDSDPEVRSLSGVSLFQSLGDRVAYDPQWEPDRRARAAAQVRALVEPQ